MQKELGSQARHQLLPASLLSVCGRGEGRESETCTACGETLSFRDRRNKGILKNIRGKNMLSFVISNEHFEAAKMEERQ